MTWYPAAENWARAARGRLYAAPATPFDASGSPRPEFAGDYFEALAAGGADGLAIAVHTGRGPHLPDAVRGDLIRIARRVCASVVVGVDNPHAVRLAALAGADAALVFPAPGESEAVRGHLDRLWESGGLPLIAFDLYSAPYSDATFAAVVDHPAVAAVKLARLSDAIACQDRIAMVRDYGKLAITGEDRMFGASLTWGAETALVGVAAAAVALTRAVLDTFAAADLPAFLAASSRLDTFAAATFREPFDGYVQRIAWVAGEQGLLPGDMLTDPYAPPLPAGERDRVLATLHQLSAVHSPTRAS